MNDLSGEDAFDKVLEAALDAHHNARRAVDLQHAAESQLRGARDDLAKALSRQQEAETERSKVQAERAAVDATSRKQRESIEALWEAANEMRKLVCVIENGPQVKAALEKLEKALANTSDFDGITF
jgi:phage shock protein A